jgi:hypothetical protein
MIPPLRSVNSDSRSANPAIHGRIVQTFQAKQLENKPPRKKSPLEAGCFLPF